MPTEDRFRVPYRAWADTARTEVLDPETRTDLVLNVVLAGLDPARRRGGLVCHIVSARWRGILCNLHPDRR
ncbi:MAG: hypothetical protein U5K37_05115 [Natrialbaceae archaeon]|nr:hypothetical protein [Natrialbaceae archaeon]